MNHHVYLEKAVALALEGMNKNAGGPFGCVIVKDGEIIAAGHNEVTSTNDPSAHAEIVAIRRACAQLGTFQLTGCTIYTSCEPCPMCLGAIYWARPNAVYFASKHKDAAAIGFDDQFIYEELDRPISERRIPFHTIPLKAADNLFEAWTKKADKERY